MMHRLFCGLPLLLLALAGCVASGPPPASASLRITWAKQTLGAGRVIQVYVNGQIVGSLNNGQTGTFPINTLASGNTLIVSCPLPNGSVVRSNSHTFALPGGQTYTATCAIQMLPTGVANIVFLGAGRETEAAPVVTRTILDSAVRKSRTDSEDVSVPRGVKRTVKKSRTITHSIEQTQSTQAEGTLGAQIGVISGQIRLQLEKQIGRRFEESETVEQAVELDGNIHSKYRLTWYDRYRTGKVTYTENGLPTTISFEFREGTELQVEEVK